MLTDQGKMLRETGSSGVLWDKSLTLGNNIVSTAIIYMKVL